MGQGRQGARGGRAQGGPPSRPHSASPQTLSVSMLLRYSHHQIFVFIGESLRPAEGGRAQPPAPVAPCPSPHPEAASPGLPAATLCPQWTSCRCWR